MRKVVKTNSKKAFTLVEVMLALAIMLIAIGVFFATIVLVVRSHTNVSAINDMVDFAMLNARAFENAACNARTVGEGDQEISVNGDGKLALNGTPLFDLTQYQVVPTGDKWNVDFTCSIKDGGLVEYTITVSDSRSSTETPAGVLHVDSYQHNGAVYVPHPEKVVTTGSSNVFVFGNG